MRILALLAAVFIATPAFAADPVATKKTSNLRSNISSSASFASLVKGSSP